MIARIENEADPRLDDYRNLTDAQLLRDRGLFMAEGRLIVRTLLTASGFRPRSVLVTAAALESLRDVLPGVAGDGRPGPPVLLVPQRIMDGIAGFHVHRGCLSAAERGPGLSVGDVIASAGAGSATIVVLENLLNHDNVGGVFRNACAFGSAGVLLSPACVDPLYRKAVRVSMGGALRVPFAYFGADDWPGGLARLKHAGFTIIALTPAAGAIDIREFGTSRTPPGRAAIMLGTEGEGLTGEALEAADLRVRIDMAPGVDSINVASACAIALHRLTGEFAAESRRGT